MRRFTVPEKTFLKNFALRHFNFQYQNKLNADDYDIRSIDPIPNYSLGYEISLCCQVGAFRIRMFLNISNSDKLSPYQIKLHSPYKEGKIGDEYFITTGTINAAHHLYNNYALSNLTYDICFPPFLKLVDGGSIILENGGVLLL